MSPKKHIPVPGPNPERPNFDPEIETLYDPEHQHEGDPEDILPPARVKPDTRSHPELFGG